MDTNFDLNMLNATFQYIFLYSCLPFNNVYNFTCPSLHNPLYFLTIIPLVIVLLGLLILLVCCCCCYFKKLKKAKGDPKSKTGRDLETGVSPLSNTSSSGALNNIVRDETLPMLPGHSYESPHPQTIFKGNSSPKKHLSKQESLTERLIQPHHEQYADRERERDESFRTAFSETPRGRTSTDFKTPKPCSASMEMAEQQRHSTYTGTSKPNIYPHLPYSPPRSNTMPSNLKLPESNRYYKQPLESPTEEQKPDSPLMDYSVSPTPVHQAATEDPIVVHDGENYSFTKKHSLGDFSGNFNIKLTTSINSNSSVSCKRSLDVSDIGSSQDSCSLKKPLLESSLEGELSLKERLGSVDREQKLSISCPPVIPNLAPVEVSEEPNVSDNGMPVYTASEVESSIAESQFDSERAHLPHNIVVGSKSNESDSSACPSLVTDTVRDRYPITDTPNQSFSQTTFKIQTENELYNGNVHPDIIPPIEHDLVSHVTHLPSSPVLDGPPVLLDYNVNMSSGTIHTIYPPDLLNNPDEAMECKGKSSTETDSTKPEPDYSMAPLQLPIQVSNSPDIDIDVTRGLGPNHMYRASGNTTNASINDTTCNESIPSPSHTNQTEYLSANMGTEFQSISPLPDANFTDDNDIDNTSELSLVSFPETIETNYSIILEQYEREKLNKQQQQQQQVPKNIPIHSNPNEQVVGSDSYIELPKYSPVEESHIGHLSDTLVHTPTPPAIEASQNHDTIILGDSVSLPINYIANADEVPDFPVEGNDAVPLNFESIVPVKENHIEVPQSDNGSPLKDFDIVEESHLPLRSVEFPITFSDYIAKEWIGTSENAKRVRNGYKELEKMDYTHLMSIRGDNYCAIRSSLFQTFCVRDFNVCSFLADMKPPVQAKEIVAPMMQKYPFLNKWSFANKKSFHQQGNVQKVLEICVGALAYEIHQYREWKPLDRMVYIYKQLNTQPETYDFTLMEALKFYMFITAAEYWELFSNGKEVPESILFLFLREDSANLEDFLVNHLNAVGDSGGLEMVEMFLLGMTLDLQIKVARISSFGKEDFISYFPGGKYPPERIISLSAEDDRHYNALSTLSLLDLDDFFLPVSVTTRTKK
eukprot:TRINITY_DN1390_c0_g1_i6.p1 TRINITY_DN1390_c0_g1~~TRINITY_DN1390_c0_g1_i6.p1  ORF type:complete len:1099 (+),score=195.47 TRINITY_DN1390_c0_g1_i6:39-3335(+)